MIKKIIIIILSIFIVLILLGNKKASKQDKIEQPTIGNEVDYLFGFKSYKEIIQTVCDWGGKNPSLVDVGYYGKTELNNDQFYFKISNEKNPSKKIVLLTACIHGNEPWSTSTIMAFSGKIISQYGKNEKVTKLINERTIYIIPVVSPDTYPVQRNINGVDPNRNFPTYLDPEKDSITSIKNLRDFFLEIKPNAVLSGHTYGRIFLIPWGDNNGKNPNHKEYERIAYRMCELSNYEFKRVAELYGHPILGTETDWYHRAGSFAMVMEIGNHHGKATKKETMKEIERTFESITYFIEEAPLVKIIN